MTGVPSKSVASCTWATEAAARGVVFTWRKTEPPPAAYSLHQRWFDYFPGFGGDLGLQGFELLDVNGREHIAPGGEHLPHLHECHPCVGQSLLQGAGRLPLAVRSVVATDPANLRFQAVAHSDRGDLGVAATAVAASLPAEEHGAQRRQSPGGHSDFDDDQCPDT